jgi:UDP-N-acetylglucosamine:LPS N-acetylglucosamine transferase
MPRVLVAASGGGHWVQLRRLAPAVEHVERVWLTIDASHRDELGSDELYIVNDATLWNPLAMLVCALRTALVLMRVRPDVVITTGAAPGLFAILFGKLFGARTVWIDSIANAEQLSGSGRYARFAADLWLTQWPHLAKPDGPFYAGGVF